MRRREFISLLGGAAMWPVAARAQQPQNKRRIAFVHSGFPADQLTETAGPFWVQRFYGTLRALGDVDGSNLIVERYSAEGRLDHFPALVAEVISRKPDVIVSNFNPLLKAFAAATFTIPIVMIAGDPVGGGLVKSLGHPGGNITGVSINAGPEINGKRLQILQEAFPSAAKVAYLVSSRGVWDGGTGLATRQAAQQLGITPIEWFVSEVNEVQLRRTFAEMARQQLDAAVVDEGGNFLAQRLLVAELANEQHIRLLYPYRDYVEVGGLMAYAPDLGELAQRLANVVHQILNGAKPSDIPIYQPTKYQLVINLKVMKALGLTVPPTLLARADEVIE